MTLLDRLLTLAFSEQSGRFIAEDGSTHNITAAFDPLGGFSTYSEMQTAIHKGQGYSIFTLGTISGNSTKYILLNTGDQEVHLADALFEFSDGGLEIRLFEDIVVSATGTVQAIRNLRRIAPRTAALSHGFIDPTVVSEGTELAVVGVYGSTKAPASGAIASGRVLSPNTSYAVAIKNTNASVTVSFSATLIFHEHTV